jgi:hypothetical protein
VQRFAHVCECVCVCVCVHYVCVCVAVWLCGSRVAQHWGGGVKVRVATCGKVWQGWFVLVGLKGSKPEG